MRFIGLGFSTCGIVLVSLDDKRLGNAEHHDLRGHNFSAARERRGSVVGEHKILARLAGKVHDHVKALRRQLQQRGQRHGSRQQAAIGADHVELRTRHAMSYAFRIRHDQVHVQEARVGAVEHAQAVAPRLNVNHRPRLAVHAHGVAKELGNPELVRSAVSRGIKERAVRIEQPVLHDQRDLELPLGKVQRIFHRVTDQVRAGQAPGSC